MPFDDYALIAESDLDRAYPPAKVTGTAALLAELDGAEDDLAPQWASLADIETNPPPPRRWVLDQWLPFGAPTILLGKGGTGKSLLLQQLATCIPTGREFFGQAVATGKVLAWLTEDDNDEVRRRQRAICRALDTDPAVLQDRLYIEGRAGKDNVLMVAAPNGEMVETQAFRSLERAIGEIGPSLVALDNAGQMFAGNENVRSQVTQFCNKLAGLAVRYNCALLLLGHTAKADGSEYSGSTAWDAAVRSRLWLVRNEDGSTELRRRKANYASTTDEATLRITWRAGAFMLDDGSQDTAPLVIADARAALLLALDTLTGRQTATSHVATARNYLPRIARTEGLLDTVAIEVARRALATLLDDGTLTPSAVLGWKKSDRHPAMGLARSRP